MLELDRSTLWTVGGGREGTGGNRRVEERQKRGREGIGGNRRVEERRKRGREGTGGNRREQEGGRETEEGKGGDWRGRGEWNIMYCAMLKKLE